MGRICKPKLLGHGELQEWAMLLKGLVVVETPAPAALGEPMDIMTALQLVLKKSLAHGGLVRGLHEGAKAIEKHAAQLCVLAEDCNQPDYLKLVKALCADHNVNLITVPSAKTLGEWAGLCKIDSERKGQESCRSLLRCREGFWRGK
ncbi:UNVERIFIED_CONTAM: 40S ribosomal protein S12 [Sesamum angustifolium]|uniref:40S ribosomal protein S12 n=1 Tax=Sesamum angustifolium TaxID=2727405 RepID=A0AAW2LJ67_9LAMI